MPAIVDCFNAECFHPHLNSSVKRTIEDLRSELTNLLTYLLKALMIGRQMNAENFASYLFLTCETHFIFGKKCTHSVNALYIFPG